MIVKKNILSSFFSNNVPCEIDTKKCKQRPENENDDYLKRDLEKKPHSDL